jgi:hypothetical protein
LKIGADSAHAGEKAPGIGPAAATVAASAKGNFKPSRRVNMGISLGTYSQRRPDKGVVQAFVLYHKVMQQNKRVYILNNASGR